MIQDASLSVIIESLKASHEKKLKQDHSVLKDRILTQFAKLSKEELLNQAIQEVYCVKLFDKPQAPLYSLTAYPMPDEALLSYLLGHLKDFYKETKSISEDGFNLMTFFEYLLNAYSETALFWCSYPQISYDILEEADTFYFTLIKFDKIRYKKNLSFMGEIHPMIKALNYAWISHYKEASYDNAFRRAAATTNDLLGMTWDHINILSTLKYEGSKNNGSLLFIDQAEPMVGLSLESPVPLSSYRQIRKLLQMSQKGHYLLINADYMAIGFGETSGDQSLFRLDFLDHLNWKLYKGNEEFISCANLLPILPNNGNNLSTLKNELKAIFNDLGYDEDLLIQIVEEANLQRQGTMIVISESAQKEADRLYSSSLKIQPTKLSRYQVKMVTGIDGALIIDSMGYCYAIGTILDGSATDNGDSSRGARYNSAVRYMNAQKEKGVRCVIAVFSEDSYIDILSSK